MGRFVTKTAYVSVGTMNTWFVNSVIFVCKDYGHQEG